MNGKALALCARRSQMGTNPCLSMSFATSSGDAPRRRGSVKKQDVIATLDIAVLECKTGPRALSTHPPGSPVVDPDAQGTIRGRAQHWAPAPVMEHKE
jgi:hypothetical protein